MEPYTHRIYVKEPGFKRFKPLDMRNWRYVANLIYATMLTESEAMRVTKEMQEQNPEFIIEARKV